MAERNVPLISMRDFDSRRKEIAQQIIRAAENIGFFALVDHAISTEEIEAQFALSRSYFALDHETKIKIPYNTTTSLGYENKAQYRPGTGFDQKESFFVKPGCKMPTDDEVAGFAQGTESFLAKCAQISDQVLYCFGEALGFPENYFRDAMDTSYDDCNCVLRLIHYPAVENAQTGWRHGSHTDIGCLTLLFQRDNQDGLEVLPGRETHDSQIKEGQFFPVAAKTGPIVINIGDMLSKFQPPELPIQVISSLKKTVAWSDDRFKANFHRVRAKEVGYSPERFTLAYFNMGRKDFVFQGPQKKYAPTTCGEYLLGHLKNQFEKAKSDETRDQVKTTRLTVANSAIAA